MRNLLRFSLAVSAILFSVLTFGQYKPADNDAYPELIPMSSYDSLMLSQLPELRLSESTVRRLIPAAVDNSQLPWFRPLVAQVGLECGQASSIGVAFTYEIDFLRQAPANLPQNQYTTHFTYNFINGGTNTGISYYETYEILKKAGNPTVADYGGMAPGGPSRWMSGYNEYYNAMHNRVTEVYSIKVNTLEGLQTLKNWIYDHGNGSSAGGVGCFYAQYSNPPATLPAGTPEAGKHVITAWGSSANHSMTICGYNDSIRWDYNEDGQYTNHIDITGDGIVDIRDWEIGGFKMANTYGSISGWGDEGFSYMMYKSVADLFTQGGIWNNTVVVTDVRDNHLPQLTAKINMSHSCRNSLKVTVGVSSDPQAAQPDHILHFPIFDFQGGCNPMQGIGFPETIEFGLDLNPLLTYVEPGEEAKYFLMIQENDPLSGSGGSLISFSLIDYTSGVNQINCPVNEIPLVDHGITMVSVNASINYDPVLITTMDLPPLQIYSSYTTQLTAEGGTPPYRWHIAEDYARTDSSAVMPVITQTKLTPNNNSSGKAEVNLPFIFPFFGNEITKVYVTSDGYLMFENSLLPWPFYIEGRTYFMQKAMIAPCMSHPFIIDPGQGDGIWYEETEDYVTFRWKLSVYQVSGGLLNATARLYPDGTIEFNYGECLIPSFTNRFAGISAGDGENYVILSSNPDFIPVTDQFIRFNPMRLHQGIQLSETGVLSGSTNRLYDGQPIKICATDKNNIRTFKTFMLNTEGLQMEYSVTGGEDDIIEFGETCMMTLEVTNLNSYVTGPLTLNLASLDPYLNITAGTSVIPGLQPGQAYLIENAFTFIASNQVPDAHLASLIISASSAEGNWSRTVRIQAFRPVISISGLEVFDGNNGILEPGENALLRINLSNTGGAKLANASASLSSWDPYIILSGTAQTKDTLLPQEEWQTTFMAALDAATPLNYVVQVNLNVTGYHQFDFLQTIPMLTGFIAEDFESGNFENFDWETGGSANWFIEDGNAYEGNHNARSGQITDNQTSSLWLNWNVAFADSVSFWFKVSSEANYDFLRFFSDSEELGKWAGNRDWTYARMYVPAGEQVFSWRYTKDYSASTGEDCARIDYIMLPVYAVPTGISGQVIPVSAFSVYPNPSQHDLKITWTLTETSPVTVMITDLPGRVCYHYDYTIPLNPGTYQIEPAFDGSGPGSYLIVLKTNKGTLVKKLIRTGQ